MKWIEQMFSHALSPVYQKTIAERKPWIFAPSTANFQCEMNSGPIILPEASANVYVLIYCPSHTGHDLQLFQQITESHTEVSMLPH